MHTFLVLVCLLGLAGPQAAPGAPRVVASTVEDGQDDVDPALVEIRVTFDQPMSPTSWSVVGGGDNFLEITAPPRWIDEKTIAISVALRPGHEYWLSINSDSFKGFRSRSGVPAVPQPIAFRTRLAGAASRPAELTLEQNREAITRLRKAIDNDYAYRDRLTLDWNALLAEHEPAMESAITPNAFARAVARLLRAADDGHVYVKAGERVIGTHVNDEPSNFDPQALERIVPELKRHDGGVATGLFGDGTAYLLIPAWNAETAKGIESVYALVKDSPALIIDVRLNGGGDERLARVFAGRFVAQPTVYSRNRIRRAGEWHGPFDRVVEPGPDAERYRGRVAVMIGPKVGSSCESFVLMMRHGAGAALVGAPTRGSSGNPKPHELGNGVTVFLSSWEDQDLDGRLLEGRGVMPDIAVAPAAGSGDAVLNAARRSLAEGAAE